MKLSSQSFAEGDWIPAEYAFCRPAETGHACLSDNISPHLAWEEAPAGTRSFVLICHDPDVPSRGDDVNQEGRSVPASLPRVDFFHWLLVDLPDSVTELARGSFSEGVTPGGKPGPQAAQGSRQGINDYTAWFAGGESMRGDYYGYDGPCPPWNDELRHRYVFTVYALDVASLTLGERFNGAEVRKAMEGHVLAQASLTGLYSLNPAVRPPA